MISGNDYKLVLDKFQELYDAGKADDNYDLQMLSDLRHKGFQNSIKENPYCKSLASTHIGMMTYNIERWAKSCVSFIR